MAAVRQSDVTMYQMYIGGRRVDASNGATAEILDPSTEEVFARVPKATVADAETAVKAARDAFDNGPWPRMKVVERGEILRRAATRIRERADELALLESRQMGKLFADADFEAAIDGVLVGIFAGAGEVCSAGSRLIVERAIYDRFVGELVSRAMAIKVGPALDEYTEVKQINIDLSDRPMGVYQRGGSSGHRARYGRRARARNSRGIAAVRAHPTPGMDL
ncbi:MAG: aldehyde dehydrogenase family protein, partial [Actinobacteria bacterium]|nr:aldehyde dehydrogenase family protein [Actinomycetota bacterium]